MTDHTAKARSEFSYDLEKLLITQYMSNWNFASEDSSRKKIQTYDGEYDVLTYGMVDLLPSIAELVRLSRDDSNKFLNNNLKNTIKQPIDGNSISTFLKNNNY